MISIKNQTAVLLIIVAVIRSTVGQSHLVDYQEDDAQRETQENVITKSLQDLLDMGLDFYPETPQSRFSSGAVLPAGSRLINPWYLQRLGLPASYMHAPHLSGSGTSESSISAPRYLPKRKESPSVGGSKRYNKYLKKADSSDRKSRNSNYRQCFFNPISCFRK